MYVLPKYLCCSNNIETCFVHVYGGWCVSITVVFFGVLHVVLISWDNINERIRVPTPPRLRTNGTRPIHHNTLQPTPSTPALPETTHPSEKCSMIFSVLNPPASVLRTKTSTRPTTLPHGPPAHPHPTGKPTRPHPANPTGHHPSHPNPTPTQPNPIQRDVSLMCFVHA